jgi:hypothetical protein
VKVQPVKPLFLLNLLIRLFLHPPLTPLLQDVKELPALLLLLLKLLPLPLKPLPLLLKPLLLL